MAEKRAAGSVVLTHAVGLHARPSVKLTKLAKAFASRIEVAAGEGGGWIDAKSIVKVMAMKARQGAVLQLRAEGVDADLAVEALVRLVERDFDEAPAPAGDAAHAGAG
jgi:phosphocarrier protein